MKHIIRAGIIILAWAVLAHVLVAFPNGEWSFFNEWKSDTLAAWFIVSLLIAFVGPAMWAEFDD